MIHVFHKMSVRMTSVKNLQAMLEWLRVESDKRFRFSNGYTGVRVDTDLYILKDHLLEKNNWNYEVISVKELQQKACTWNDLLEGRYEYTLIGYVEEVKVFSKSDPIRKLFKGFEFLPKVTVHNSLPKVTVHNSITTYKDNDKIEKEAHRIIIRVK